MDQIDGFLFPPPTPAKGWLSSDEWRQHLYNQERMVTGQQQLTTIMTNLLEQQRSLALIANKFNEHLELLGDQMQGSIRSMGEFNRAIIKVPIVVVIIGLASWGFYSGRLSEHTWLIIMGVATFPYLGEGITAIAKLFGFRNGEKK
jgi:hypothetical protein